MTPSEATERVAGIAFLLLTAVGMVAILGFNFVRDRRFGDPLTAIVAETAVPLLFVGVVVGVAVWLWRRQWSGRDTVFVALWAALAVLISAFNSLLGVVHQSLVTRTIEPFVHFSTTTMALTALGCLYGVSRVRQRQQRKLREQARERELHNQRESFEQLVENVEDYAIFRLDAEGRIQTWNRGAEEMKGYTTDEILDESIETFYPADEREAGKPQQLLEKAREEGRAETEGWRVRKDGTRFWARVVVTALYDDAGDLRGYIKVTRDLTERREYEHHIEHERERLAFLNRLLRHNLLNGLNLINARADILASELPDDADAHHHIDVIHERVMDMSELIEAMKTLMDAVVSEADHDLSAAHLREVLGDELALARDAHEGAVFDVHDLPDPEKRVVADELVGEIFENVLDNAVVHNDEVPPEVELWTTQTTCEAFIDADSGELVHGDDPSKTGEIRRVDFPALTVHVRDNGPGIPDEEKDAITEKGGPSPTGPKHGFGLYLVRELVEVYGGEFDIRDADRKGTVVEVTLLQSSRASELRQG